MARTSVRLITTASGASVVPGVAGRREVLLMAEPREVDLLNRGTKIARVGLNLISLVWLVRFWNLIKTAKLGEVALISSDTVFIMVAEVALRK